MQAMGQGRVPVVFVNSDLFHFFFWRSDRAANKRHAKSVTDVLRSFASTDSCRVTLKFEAEAAFCIPFEDGSGWNSTAGARGNGKVQISSHRRKDEDDACEDITVVRWLNGWGKDGMNLRIIPLPPIRRGEDPTEFFLKGASTATSGVSRKTIFAVKFIEMDKANEFEMWWHCFSGQLRHWIDVHVKRDTALAKSDKILNQIVKIERDAECFPRKRRFTSMELKSPTATSVAAVQSPDWEPKKKKEIIDLTEGGIVRREGAESSSDESSNATEPDSDRDPDDEPSPSNNDEVWLDVGIAPQSQTLNFL